MKEEGGGEEKEKEETKRNKELKGEEDKSQASGVGEVGGPERWGTKEVRQEVGHMGGASPPTLVLGSQRAAPGWVLWGEEGLK